MRSEAMKLTTRCVIVLAVIAGSVGLARAEDAAKKPAPRPNILFLLSDDLRWDGLGCTGNSFARTPNLDALAARGTLFRNHFVTTSICCVSRASILSGQYARRHGINDFVTPFTPAAFAKTYPALLRAAGYRTGFIGKFGVGEQMPEREFDYWRGFPGQGHYFQKGDPTHITKRMADQALEFLSDADRRPFCLSVSFKAPHCEDNAKREFPPDPRDEGLFAGVTFPVPATAAEKFYRELPGFVQHSEGRVRWERRFATPEMFQKTVADYYRLATGMDREIGRILAALKERGAVDDTLVVFTSDNGFFFGERGMAGKWLMYEPSIRVPLVIADPRAPATARGRAEEAMSLNVDFAPTLLDYAGIAAPAATQGRSLRPLVRGEKVTWRDEWFYEHLTLPKIIPPCEGVRTDRWKYLRWVGVDPAVEELYDLKADPSEEHNLVANPQHRRTLDGLRSSWVRLRQELK
jgi:arylsulfatase A-like enzyme